MGINMKRTSAHKITKTLNRSLSMALSKKIPLADNRCFQNSYWALRHVPGRAWLVIGLANLWPHTVRHAWIETSSDIIDPSWIVLLEKDEVPAYLPSHRYTKAQVKKLAILKSGRVHREAMFSEWYDFRKEFC
jgi:hypothetical protein